MRVAIYPGSFDPPTHGHLDVIRRGASLFDELIVGVGNNTSKKYWFDAHERQQMLRQCCSSLPNVRVEAFSGLLVDACQTLGASVILRGLRAIGDFDMEFRNGLANRDLAGIETIFLLSEPGNVFVSSSLVREITSFGGDVSRYVPAEVLPAVHARRP